MSAHVLVTGGAGYLGSILCEHLLHTGYRVTVLDSLRYGGRSLFHLCAHPRFDFIHGDVRDEALVRSLVAKADTIVPLAAIVGAPACNLEPDVAQSTNLDAIRLINRVRSTTQLVIFPTTNSGYGIGERDVLCTEETPLRPVSLYGRLKVEAERMVLDEANTISLRLATVFGISPRMRLDLLVNDFVYRAVTDGFVVLFEADFKRNYIHVRDVARAFNHCLTNFARMKGEPYNVGLNEANLSKRELCEEIRKQVPRFSVVEAEVGRDPDQRNYIVSNAKIERTGFKPLVSLETGIAELVKGYQVIRRPGYSNV